jgi:hypothetical protein
MLLYIQMKKQPSPQEPTEPTIPTPVIESTDPQSQARPEKKKHNHRALVAGVGMAAAAASGVILIANNSEIGQDRPPASAEAPSVISYEAAKPYVEDIANRFEACGISSELAATRDPKTQNARLKFDVTAVRNKAGLEAEAKFANDDSIIWTTAIDAFTLQKDEHGKRKLKWEVATAPLASGRGDLAEKAVRQATVYPDQISAGNKQAYQEGDEIAIYLGTDANTTLPVSHTEQYRSYTGKYCGTLLYTKGEDGQLQWQTEVNPPELPDMQRTQACPIAQNPNNPSSYTVQC